MPASRLPSLLAALLDRFRHLGSEAMKFGVVGMTGVGFQFVVFNLLRFAGPDYVGVLEAKPVTAQILAISGAGVITYLGNRHWTYRHRVKGKVSRELPVFTLLNVVAIGIGALCLAFSHYVLGLTSPLADNLSGNVLGLGLGTLFRFWSYRRFVFTGSPATPTTTDQGDPASEPPASR